MKIKHLPLEIQEKVFEKQIEQGNKTNSELYLFKDKKQGNFNWASTHEGYDFWHDIFCGNYNNFYKKYPNNNTPIWIKLLAIISIVFITYILAEVLIEFIN
jgi:hypothetical protein